jgi:hypothetical protein
MGWLLLAPATGGAAELPVSFANSLRSTTGAGPYAMVVAYLNADEIPDLVSANVSRNDVSVLCGNGRVRRRGCVLVSPPRQEGGGDFWDKLRALLVHDARATFP